MENIAHSLIGVVLGEGVLRLSRVRHQPISPALRAGVLWAAVLGSNMPDSDMLLPPFVGGGSLGSLLHHRGFTHTVALSVPLALVAAAVSRWIARARERVRVGSEAVLTSSALPSWKLLLLVAWMGVMGHITADGWNDYGVHPFWPLTNEWIYGDLIFILEPMFWLSLLPFVFFLAETRFFKGLCVFLALVLMGLCWSGKFLGWPVALWLTTWGMVWTLVHYGVRKKRALAVVLAIAALVEVLGVFAVGRGIARARVLDTLPPGEELLALSTSPAPGNPFCWRVIMTSKNEGTYVARVGAWAMGPSDPSRCLPRTFPMVGPHDVLTHPVSKPALLRPGFAWAGEFRAEIGALSQLLQTHCRFKALLRFVRVPFWTLNAAGSGIAGDLRYHSPRRTSFAEIETVTGEDCYALEPPWDPPSGLIKF